jgi:DNA-binding NtrC family response regulator
MITHDAVLIQRQCIGTSCDVRFFAYFGINLLNPTNRTSTAIYWHVRRSNKIVNQATWSSWCSTVLGILDPASGPQQILERVWQACATWNVISGILLHINTGHLVPSGQFRIGEGVAEIDDDSENSLGTTTISLAGNQLLLGRRIRDGNVQIATVIVAYVEDKDFATFLIEALARWSMDRLRLQLEVSELSEENISLRNSLTPHIYPHQIRSVSGVMHSLIKSAARAAASTATVLIQGETGTGKELLARLVHSHSQRANHPIVSVNVAALSPSLVESELFGHAKGAFTGADNVRKGLFEIANGGTLFLDEVGEMSAETQVRLLRVLQERCITRVGDHRSIMVDVRIIAATHRDLIKDVEAGNFREDLFYRLNVINLHVPPLRRRKEDIPILFAHFLEKHNQENYKQVDDVPQHIMEMLCNYPWPGNVRELENYVQKAVVLATGRKFPEDLIPVSVRSYKTKSDQTPPDESAPAPHRVEKPALALDDLLSHTIQRWADQHGGDLTQASEVMEQEILKWALSKEKGVKLRAARLLGINRVTLDRKLAHYGLEVERGGILVAHKPPQSDSA